MKNITAFKIDKDKKYEGSFTVEAVIVLSTILIIMFAIFYAFMLMYQYVIVTRAATYAAQQGATTWVNSGLNIDNGTGTYNSELYYRVAEFVPGSDVRSTKEQKIKDCARSKLQRGILPVGRSDIDVQFKNYVFQRQIHVTIRQEIPIPFSGIAQFFTDGEEFAVTAKAIATVPEPAEFIRNADYAFETATVLIEFIDEKLGISDGFAKFKDALGNLR